MFNQNYNLLLSSKNGVIVFELTHEKKIKYTIYDYNYQVLESGELIDDNILKYSVLIDDFDIIHLVVLLRNGDLNYYNYKNNAWSKSAIAKFDLRTNLYNQIEILMINNKLNILFNYSNLVNSNIWTIQHVVYGTEERHNAIRYISKKVPDAFSIDVDSQGVIHLLYRTYINNVSHIFHGFYSPFTNSWNSKTKQISTDKTNNIFPFVLIDSKDNIHALWIEESNNKSQLKYMKMSSGGKERYIWKEVALPHISISNFPPIILEEENILKIIYQNNNSIITLISTDYGTTFNKEKEFKTSKDIDLIGMKLNINPNSNKIKLGYCNLSLNPKPYFFEEIFNQPPNEVIVEEPIKDEVNNIVDNFVEVDSITEKGLNLDDIGKKLDEILENQIGINLILNNIITTGDIHLNELNEIKKLIYDNKGSFFRRLFG